MSLPEVTEEPHFDRTSFRVRGKIFLTARSPEPHVHVFVPEQQRGLALAMYPDHVAKLFWGEKVVGLRIALSGVPVSVFKDLIRCAWESRAPKTLVATMSQ
jgi:hypothetical protein